MDHGAAHGDSHGEPSTRPGSDGSGSREGAPGGTLSPATGVALAALFLVGALTCIVVAVGLAFEGMVGVPGARANEQRALFAVAWLLVVAAVAAIVGVTVPPRRWLVHRRHVAALAGVALTPVLLLILDALNWLPGTAP